MYIVRKTCDHLKLKAACCCYSILKKLMTNGVGTNSTVLSNFVFILCFLAQKMVHNCNMFAHTELHVLKLPPDVS